MAVSGNIPVATASTSSSMDASLNGRIEIGSHEVTVDMGFSDDEGCHRTDERKLDSAPYDMKLVQRWKSIFLGVLVALVLTGVTTIIELLRNYSSTTIIVLVALLTALTFFSILTFVMYDRHMQGTNHKIVHNAAKSTEFVSSMFPANMHQRLFDSSMAYLPSDETLNDMKDDDNASAAENGMFESPLRTESGETSRDGDMQLDTSTLMRSKPIAELYPETTIMLADLVGFTAWSSTREPTQVFILLESIFRVFDNLAIRRKIFKVETVGDCYVAVAGVPEPRSDHAVAMARFAQDCLSRFTYLVHKLELTLGPGTADLGMRIGLHSGPITGGILRGERSRFQLFGDTINTAARMESNSMRGRIQVSEQTADLLFAASKENWLIKREDKIDAKGKGKLQTYWLDIKGNLQGSASDQSSGESDDTKDSPSTGNQSRTFQDSDTENGLSRQHAKLVDFNTDCLVRLLKQISARRAVSKEFNNINTLNTTPRIKKENGSVRDEVEECIQLPAFNAGIERSRPMDAENIELAPRVVEELRDYLKEICKLYNRSNYFHNFEHATHVAMSVLKLISRIVSPLELLSKQFGSERRLNASKLYDHTYGLTSDPLTLFACAFSALIHDAGHPGVPNTQLVKEDGDLAKKYNNQSVAEQHSFNISWDLLMSDSYANLRSAIFMSPPEQDHFRQIVVNCVMATDILDPELKESRNRQWRQAFSSSSPQRRFDREMGNRKATIVIEHLMQTSDIAHTMQHWHIFCKWNERLYREQLVAFLTGRTDQDPTVDWYESELRFFDFCVIPLAQKLKECGVFGVSSHEYLNYAMNNRKEWESTGREIVAEMSEQCKAEISADLMRHTPVEGDTTAPPTNVIRYTISDQLGPESLLLTNSWSKDNATPTTPKSLLGQLDRSPTPDADLF